MHFTHCIHFCVNLTLFVYTLQLTVYTLQLTVYTLQLTVYTLQLTVLFHIVDSLVVECWLRVREVQGSIPSQGPRQTMLKMVPVVPLFGTQH